MESKARFMGHSIHQMLVAFPVGLLLASVAFDGLAVLAPGTSMSAVAYWILAAGIVGGLVAAPFGLIDLLAIPYETRARHVGGWHAVGNLIVLCLFFSSWVLRPEASATPPVAAVVLSLAGAVSVLVTAWMGGELVSRMGVGVSSGAHADASSSLLGPIQQQGPAAAPMPSGTEP